MVDWPGVLGPVGNPRGAFSRATRQPDVGQLSFNHSRYGPWVDRPIVISVETMHEGENIQQAYIQLAVWASAHMNFLCQVSADAASVTASEVAAGIVLPPLPLLIAQSSQWSFLFASRQADGTTYRPWFGKNTVVNKWGLVENNSIPVTKPVARTISRPSPSHLRDSTNDHVTLS
ncbi:hypothetical protein KCU67_g1671, partial [Aureobasidium melanogenum]